MTGWYNPLYTANNKGFGHCSFAVDFVVKIMHKSQEPYLDLLEKNVPHMVV